MRPGLAQQASPADWPAPVVPLLAPEGQGAWSPHAARMRAMTAACLPSPLFDLASPEAPSSPWPHSLSPAPLPSSLSLSLATPERTGEHRRTPTRPQPPPSLLAVSPSSASTIFAYPPKEATPDARQRLHRRRLQASAAGNPTVDSTPSRLPRARRRHLWIRCEPLHRLPLLS